MMFWAMLGYKKVKQRQLAQKHTQCLISACWHAYISHACFGHPLRELAPPQALNTLECHTAFATGTAACICELEPPSDACPFNVILNM
jgi:hypothetical protein